MAQTATTNPSSPSEPELAWSPRTAAQACGFKTPVTILRAWRRGEIPGFKLNSRTVRFRPGDIRDWLERARVGG